MDGFIKKIFDSRVDELVHLQFQKFSRGVFKDRAMVKASKSAKGFSISTTNEYAQDMVRAVANLLGTHSTQVTGVIVSTMDLKGKVPSTGLKQFMGIKQYVISGSMMGNEIITLIDSVPEAFFALSFSAGETILKIKPKAPKSAKPSTSEKGPKVDFCSLKTTNENLARAFIFDAPASWKSIEVKHDFVINDIEVPAGISNPNEMRRLAKRKGKIVRYLVIDGKESVHEKPFSA